MEEIALLESDKVINDARLKIRLKDCTLEFIRNILDPGRLPGIFREDTPYSWDFLTVFTTSPNEYRKKQARKTSKAKLKTPTEPDEWDEIADEDPFVGETGGFWKDAGFARNATFALVFVFSRLAFTRNTGTNVFPMILGLFLEIGGTSSRILSTLSNAGACVSITTIKRLKKTLSEDAVAHAVSLINGPDLFYIIFDNINIFLRKSQQRLFNKNSMIHATNAAVIGLPDAVPAAEDLAAKQRLRGKRAAATGSDIIPTNEDEQKMFSSFVGIVMTLIIADEMLKAAEDMMASDRPLPPKKSDARPIGVFDVNEGSKKGIIQMLKSLQDFSGVDEEQWSSKARIIVCDWLTSSNIRGARRDRMDDGLLNRTWDAEKPNYADAKALIRHSLIARILYEVMTQDFVANFTEAPNIQKAKNTNDDYYAHSQYFVGDALIFCVYEHDVAFADAGIVLRVLKYWAFSFRGAGLHNYARECIEILLQWKYELTPEMQAMKEQAWFFSRFGGRGRSIASDMYLEQNNFWVKRVNIAKGSGVTIKYIIEKGSAPVEAFRELSHKFARTFGFADRSRRHKEVDVAQDLRLLAETMIHAKLHVLTANRPVYMPLKVSKKGVVATGPRVSAIVDSFVVGAQALHGGKFREFIRSTAWDPASGYPVEAEDPLVDSEDPLLNGTVFDQVDENPLGRDGFRDTDDGDTHSQSYLGLGALGGGLE
ncbi:hypothetical protein R3P38DRAFT_3321058 [Favolaschia claudopus]|uniref:DUF6589 domain-containing protein n=1 Tax=Favolaschia claudopus TaxID=2862362 RepID=A0AAW0AUS5_9AGAR